MLNDLERIAIASAGVGLLAGACAGLYFAVCEFVEYIPEFNEILNYCGK